MHPSCQTTRETELAHVARELARICDRLEEEAAVARSLSALTNWQSRAATEYRTRADAWAQAVTALGPLAESARWSVARARARAAAAAAFANGCA